MEEVLNSEGKRVLPVQAAALFDGEQEGYVFDDEQYKTLTTKTPTEELKPGGSEEENKEEQAEVITTEESEEAEENKEPVTASETTEENKPGEETTTGTESVIENKSGIDYDRIAEEKSGGKYKKWDDLIAATEEKKYVNDESKRIHELLLTGEEGEQAVHEYLSMKRLLGSLDKLSDEDKVKLQIQFENPEFTQEQVNEEFDLVHGLDVDENNVSDDQLAKIKARRDRNVRIAAKGAQTFLEGMRKDVKLPELKSEAVEKLTAIEKEQAEFKKLNDDLVAAIDKDISSITELDLGFQIDKDNRFDHKYTVSDKERKQAADEIKNYWQTFLSRYYKDGQWQTKQIMEDRLFLANRSNIIKSAVTKARTHAKVNTVKGIANATTEKPPVVPTNFTGEAAAKEHARYALM